MCGNEQISVSERINTYQLVVTGQLSHINITKWFSVDNPECPITQYKLMVYQSTTVIPNDNSFQPIYLNSTHKIITYNAAFLKKGVNAFSVVAITNSGVSNFSTLFITDCGNEVLSVNKQIGPFLFLKKPDIKEFMITDDM